MQPNRTRMFQIREDDLTDLEAIVPHIGDRLTCQPNLLDAKIKVKLRRAQQILSAVRWNYGPPDQVEIIPADGEGGG